MNHPGIHSQEVQRSEVHMGKMRIKGLAISPWREKQAEEE